MNRYLRFAAALAALAILPTGSTAEEPAAPAETVKIIADCRTTLPGSFAGGSWQGKVSTTTNGSLVLGNKGADGKGEIGENMQPLLDLTAVKYVEVALGTGPKNEVPGVTIAFNDVDGVQYTAGIRVDQIVPGQPVWFRARLSDFKLNDWNGEKTGKRINWAKIASWHLQGDWKTEAPCHVMFIALRTRQ